MKYKLLCWLNDFWYTTARAPAGYLFYLLSRFLNLVGLKKAALKFILASIRYENNSTYVVFLRRMISNKKLLQSLVSCGVGLDEASLRSIVIRWPDSLGKGVIVITFTKTFSYYLRSINLKELSNYFTLVLEPSWSGYADPDILAFIGEADNIIVQASALEDRVLLNAFPDTFIPVSFGASDWVDFDIFKDQGLKKKYDSIYIANTNPIKRVSRYLDAIKNIVKHDKDYLGCLVCASWGGMESLVRELVRKSGLNDNIELRFSLSREQVIEALNLSKVNVLLSYKEGSNRSLFEAIFCNVPAICLSENVGVNKGYINEFTGILTSDLALESALLWMSKNYMSFSPRPWALSNISPVSTTAKLLEVIKFRVGNREIPADSLLVKANNPEVSYFKNEKIGHQKYMRMVLELFDRTKNLDESILTNSIGEIKNLFEKDLNEMRSR